MASASSDLHAAKLLLEGRSSIVARSCIEKARRSSAELIKIKDNNHIYIDDSRDSHSVAGLTGQRSAVWSRVDLRPRLNVHVAGFT